MKTLNLVYTEKSDIKYTIQKFPDGQQNIVIDTKDYFLNKYTGELEDIQISSRLSNFLDLELIICSIKSLNALGCRNIHLYTPYIMGARSDRQFVHGGNNYLKDVLCPVINSLNFKSVTCIDPHSDILEACIKGFRKESNLDLVKFGLEWAHATSSKMPYGDYIKEGVILVSPDGGSLKKIYKLAEQIGYNGDIITCSKDRDKDGKLTKCVVPLNDRESHDFIIIDDICDGGATFINIAKEIKKQYEGLETISPIKIYLIVTHGIFSKSFSELSKYFDGIYCTNSYKDTYMNDQELPNHPKNFRIKQLNVY